MEVVYRGMIAVFPPDQGDGWSVEEMFAVNKNKVCYHESNRTLWPVGTFCARTFTLWQFVTSFYAEGCHSCMRIWYTVQFVKLHKHAFVLCRGLPLALFIICDGFLLSPMCCAV